jgi:anthranilate phosphoribosyltransferase
MLYVTDQYDNLKQATAAVQEHLASGAALLHLEKLQEFNRG